jgi:hypothetical protein
MLATAPMSVLLIGLFGMLVVAFAVTRMTILERRVQRPVLHEAAPRSFVRSSV